VVEPPWASGQRRSESHRSLDMLLAGVQSRSSVG
jgi:hypothetical protein